MIFFAFKFNKESYKWHDELFVELIDKKIVRGNNEEYDNDEKIGQNLAL